MKLRSMLVLLSAAVVITACNKTPSGDTPAKTGAVLAEINGARITADDFKRQQDALPAYAKGGFVGEKGNKDFLDYLVIQELFYQEAIKKGVDKQPEVKSKIDDMTRKVVLDTYLRVEIEQKISVTDQDAKAYYDSHPEEFKGQEEIRASHILVGTEAEARDIKDKLKKGAAFDKLAKQHSKDPGSKDKGGDLGYFRKGQMVPEFEKAVTELKKGEVGDPIKTQFGFHIIKVVDKRTGPGLEYDKIAERLKVNLARKKQKEVFDARVAEIKKTAKVTLNDKEIGALPKGDVPQAQGDLGASPHGGTPPAPAGNGEKK